MIYLIIVSILWSFSFGIIKYGLSGVDSSYISFIRSLIALLFFSSISIYNIKKFALDLKLILIGALQFGFMYIFYIQSYVYLPAYLIATFTITTPIFVGLASKYIAHQSISKNGIYAISLVIIGSFLMRINFVNPFDYWVGFLLIQFANLFFASGQILFKEWKIKNDSTDILHNFSQMFLGATLITSLFYLFSASGSNQLSSENLFALIFLGLISTGLGFLFWNLGLLKVNNDKLAVMNNLIIPIAILNSYFIFGEQIDSSTFVPGMICFYFALKAL
jgi:drug/metabolite transporter (DMT)-like permease|tara:strand:+ start:564 stop:1394 length:831 start_codon:yes stop_codon:yes gene_type:complete